MSKVSVNVNIDFEMDIDEMLNKLDIDDPDAYGKDVISRILQGVYPNSLLEHQHVIASVDYPKFGYHYRIAEEISRNIAKNFVINKYENKINYENGN